MKKMLTVILLLAAAFPALHAEDAAADRYRREIGVIARYGDILTTNGFHSGFNPLGRRLARYESVALQYSFAFPESSEYGRLYPSARQGVGVGLYSFGSHEYVGTPLSLYMFQGATVASLADKLTLDYEWNLGLSFGWVNDSGLTASRTNISLGGGLFLTWRPHARLKFTVGPEFMHHSNGDTSFPNLGTNTVGLRAGAAMGFGEKENVKTVARLFAAEEQKKPFGERMTYDMSLTVGWRAGRVQHEDGMRKFNYKFPIVSVSAGSMYHFNRYLSLGPSLDLVMDRSADLIPFAASYDFPSMWKQMAAGVGVKTEVRMNFFGVSAGGGYSFGQEGSVLTGPYGVFGMKTYISDKLYIGAKYILRSQRYTHNLTFGLGWRFGIK